MHIKPIKPQLTHFSTLLLSFLILFTWNAQTLFAQDKDKKDEKKYPSLLWEISGNGLSQNSYLYGTMHVSNKVAFHLSDSFFMAINSVDKVALESDPSFWIDEMFSDEYIREFGSQYQVEPYVQDFYTQAFKVDAIQTKRFGQIISHENYLMNGILYRNTLNTEHEENTYLDMYIYQAGRKLGKEVIGLEDFIESQKLVNKSQKPEKDQKLLKKYKKQYQKLLKSGKMPMEMLEDAYRRGDLDLLDSLQTILNPSRHHRRFMLDERNRIMADNMDSVMQSGTSLFSGVGSAHLAGDSGMIEMLRDMGYTLRPIPRVIGDFSRNFRDKLEKTYVPLKYEKYTSSDGWFEIDVPAPMYEMPENYNMKFYYCPEMINGTQFHISRIRTYAPMLHETKDYVMERIDSFLLYENIPGKILHKDRITVNGYPAYDIKNKSRKGDYQRYLIVVTDLELLVVKVAGTLEYLHDNNNLEHVFQSIKIKVPTSQWSTFKPKYGAFQVDMPDNRIQEDQNPMIEDLVSSKKAVLAYDNSDSSFYFLSRMSYHDFSYIEEDTFELSFLANKFIENRKYKELNREFGDLDGQPTLTVHCKDSTRFIHLKYLIHGPRYYLLLAQNDDSTGADRFFNSFRLTDFVYNDSFEIYTDTSLFYSVKTPVRPRVAAEYNSYDRYGYGDNEEIDKSHQSETKGKRYSIGQTDEYIYVGYQKYHRYQSYPHMDSMWSHISNFTAGRSMVMREYTISEDSSRMFMSVVDTNSNRTMEVQSIQKAGVLYRLYYLSDTLTGRSAFADTFFNTFEPSADTVIGIEITLNKADLLFEHINGDDSTKREQAFQSLEYLDLEEKHFDKAVNLFYHFEHEDFDIAKRAELLEEIGLLEAKEVVPFLREVYEQSVDTPRFQIAVLTALARMDNKTALGEFKKLLGDETPLVEKSLIHSTFFPLRDSLELSKALFPMLFEFTRYPEYKSDVYQLLATLLDSNIIKGKSFKKYKKDILRDAKDELKRTVGKQDDGGYSRYHYSYRSSTASLLENMNRILLEFCSDPKVQEYYSRIDRINDIELRFSRDLTFLKHNEPTNDTLWNYYAGLDEHRLPLYVVLKEQGKLNLVDDSLISQEQLAKSRYYSRNSLDEEDSLTYLFRKKASYFGKEGYLYFFKKKDKYNDEEWDVMYMGLQPLDTNDFEMWPRMYPRSMIADLEDKEEFDEEVEKIIEGLKNAHRRRVVSGARPYYGGYNYGY